MRVTVTGASGLIGSALVAELRERGTEVTVLSRDPARARERSGVEAVGWDPLQRARPGAALAGSGRGRAPRRGEHRPALERAGQARDPREPCASAPATWSRGCGRPVKVARQPGPPHADQRLRGRLLRPRGEEPLDEDSPPGNDFLAETASPGRRRRSGPQRWACAWCKCVPAWCSTARAGRLRRCCRRSSLGVGGPVAGGEQYMSWIHRDDLVGMICTALQDERWSGPSTAPRPSRSPTASSRTRSATRCTGPRCCPCRASRWGCCTGRWPRSSRRARA